MIFKEIFNKEHQILHQEFIRIFNLCIKNQTHPGNLLIWFLNGFYSELYTKKPSQDGKKFSPYVFGPNCEGYSEQTHYKFIDIYRKFFICKVSYDEYLKYVKYSPENIKEIKELVSNEGMLIQVEMLIYIKFWEMDMIIKKLYELTRIINCIDYDWHFKIGKYPREKGITGIRKDILNNKVINNIKTKSPLLSEWIESCYNTQIRNSFAHSNYSLLDRDIQLNNYEEGDSDSIFSLSFDKWYKIFHKTLVLHNELIWFRNHVGEFYEQKALKGDRIEILITKFDGKQYCSQLKYRSNVRDWGWKK